ncbi:MAG: arsenate reductase ArsC [Candidatus Tectomicrobia bacterium]|nr:arsenate reductase ArsC [Candidatus Tectomicrobia bacterium]
MQPNDSRGRKRVLFVCIENSNRSQMAEAFARMLGGARIEAWSAGARPSGRLNQKAIEAMNEVGYDLSIHSSKSLAEIPMNEYDAVISMGCGDACPFVPAKIREEWHIPDPKEMAFKDFRSIRDMIRDKVETLLARL